MKGGINEVKKRIISAVVSALLVVSMTVTAFAAGSNSGSNAASNASQPAAQPAAQPTYTTPTGQPITDTLVAQLAAVTSNGGNVAPVSKNTVIAVSNYLKAIGLNAALIASFVDLGPAGQTTISAANIVPGMDYSIIIQLADGRVVIVKPKKVANGSLVYDKPEGAISVSIATVATAPR